ncbi:hypothetical protein EB72_16665 [Mycobacterium sp. SWH-M1]|nr:hypothetical protein EB72_16665 [Mycobacterium sp. SWH-M1]
MDSAPMPAADGAGTPMADLAAAPEAAPVVHAADVAAPLPGPAVPVVPAIAPAVAPVVPVVSPPADAAAPLPALPGGLPIPRDLMCEGTAW